MATTPNLKLPYPLATDKVIDGDDAIGALAARIEARMAWGWVAYGEQVTAASGLSGSIEVAAARMTATIVTGRRYRLTGAAALINGATAQQLEVAIKDGSTVVARSYWTAPANAMITPAVSRVLVPTAGAHTYGLFVIGYTAGAFTLNAEAANPAYQLLEDTGPTVLTATELPAPTEEEEP